MPDLTLTWVRGTQVVHILDPWQRMVGWTEAAKRERVEMMCRYTILKDDLQARIVTEMKGLKGCQKCRIKAKESAHA